MTTGRYILVAGLQENNPYPSRFLYLILRIPLTFERKGCFLFHDRSAGNFYMCQPAFYKADTLCLPCVAFVFSLFPPALAANVPRRLYHHRLATALAGKINRVGLRLSDRHNLAGYLLRLSRREIVRHCNRVCQPLHHLAFVVLIAAFLEIASCAFRYRT